MQCHKFFVFFIGAAKALKGIGGITKMGSMISNLGINKEDQKTTGADIAGVALNIGGALVDIAASIYKAVKNIEELEKDFAESKKEFKK